MACVIPGAPVRRRGMKAALAPAGTRGDMQPMPALVKDI